MFLKRLCLVCASLFFLALAYHFGATNAVAKPPGGLADVAVLTGVLDDGDTIPLPVYPDGTPALESDCHWMVSINRADLPNLPMRDNCYTDGRVVRASTCDVVNGNCTTTHSAMANYMIIAIRRG
jgi:hypothetical protein